MSVKYFPLKIAKKTFLTKDSASFSFEIPDDLKKLFEYKPGQYLAFRFILNGKEYRREYSICSSPHTNEPLSFACKATNKGIVSTYLINAIKEGDTIETLQPNGSFYPKILSENKKVYLLVGGGSGITPLFSIMKSVLICEPHSKIILYYGIESEEDIMFRKEIDEFAKELPDRFAAFYTLNNYDNKWKGLKGFINPHDLGRIISNSFNNDTQDSPPLKHQDIEAFICGPLPMMDLVRDELILWRIEPGNIHIEYFTPPVPDIMEVVAEELVPRKVRVILDRDDEIITVEPLKTILQAAIDAGLDPPYSCRSGICTTCRAKLLSGKVKMDEREGLSDAEIEDGYILTCQSHPLTDDVEIEYM
jgi:ring-1,2-phenylacetyl-CoA epoxidase subunit PaaE